MTGSYEQLSASMNGEFYTSLPLLKEGCVLGERFVLDGDLLGKGGNATVYSATDLVTEDKIALKVPLADGETTLRRIARESAITELMSQASPHSLPFVDTGVAKKDGHPLVYIATNAMPGNSLWHRIVAAHESGGITAEVVADAVANPAEQLSYMHERGLAHRDVKPANLLVDNDGGGVLADFGIAKYVDSVEDASAVSMVPDEIVRAQITSPGRVGGTISNFPPELVLHSNDDGKARDAYGLGVTLHLGFTGEHPVDTGEGFGSFDAFKVAIRGYRPPTLDSYDSASVPPELAELTIALLDPNPLNRATARNAADVLQAVNSGSVCMEMPNVSTFASADTVTAKDQTAVNFGALALQAV